MDQISGDNGNNEDDSDSEDVYDTDLSNKRGAAGGLVEAPAGRPPFLTIIIGNFHRQPCQPGA